MAVAPADRGTWKPGMVVASTTWARGTAYGGLGKRLGWVIVARRSAGTLERVSIRSLGPIQLGLTKHILCVAEGQKSVYLARDGHLWRHPGVKLLDPAPGVSRMDKEQLRVYADSVARYFADRVAPAPEVELTREGITRYHKLVKALVDGRIVDAAARGFDASASMFARGVSEDWTAHDLLFPRTPTMLHALLVGLVLGLPEERAIGLIELGALIEYRVPVVGTDAAREVWRQATNLLAKLCSEWWSRSYLTDWTLVGSIDRLFRAQYARMLNQAWNRGTPVESTVQVGPPLGAPPTAEELDPETEYRGDHRAVAPDNWDLAPEFSGDKYDGPVG